MKTYPTWPSRKSLKSAADPFLGVAINLLMGTQDTGRPQAALPDGVSENTFDSNSNRSSLSISGPSWILVSL